MRVDLKVNAEQMNNGTTVLYVVFSQVSYMYVLK